MSPAPRLRNRSVSRVTAIALAAAATSVATLAFSAPAAAASTADSKVEAAVPAGFQRVVDDTGTVAITVPATWTHISTEPAIGDDRTVFPMIYAAQPSGFDAFPSVSVWVEPYRAEAGVTDIAWCTRAVQPYSGGDFTGQQGWFTGCEGGLFYQDIIASPSARQFTVTVSFAYQNQADEPLLDEITGTLEAVATAYPPPSATGPVGCFIQCHEDVAKDVGRDVSAPPALVDPSAPVWPYGPFWNVPQLGSEPVRGSGCGSQGQIGDVIPDGLWAGYVANETAPSVDIDLLCIFTGPAAQHVVTEGTATIVNDEPDYLVVNNSTRSRPMPAAPGIVLRDSAVTNGECLEAVAGGHNPEPARQAWVRIDGGQVTWILWGCGNDSPAVPVVAPAANLPPALPDYSDGIGSVWPYGQFWNVPQLGREPARGSGCGASGQLGATIPDGLWAGFVTGYDPTSNGVGIDVLCIFSGDTAQAVIADGTANIISNEPEYLIVNNNTQVRVVPSGLAAIVVGEPDAAGQCVEGTHHSPEAVDVISARTSQQAWIRVDRGVVTWIFYGC